MNEKQKQKLVDFVHSFQIENVLSEIPKGTQVSFLLPKEDIYELNGTQVEVGLGMVFAHDAGTYTISYLDKQITVKTEAIFATKEQLDRVKLLDSVIATNKIIWGNPNDLVNMKNRLLPDVDDNFFATILSQIEALSPKDGDIIICYTSDEPDGEGGETDSIEAVQVEEVYFNATILP